MAYREVTMVEVKGILRLWLDRVGKKRIAARLGLDPKTVRRYVGVGEKHGLKPQARGGIAHRGGDGCGDGKPET